MITATFGSRTSRAIRIGAHIQRDTGYGQIADGAGFRTKISDGQRIITAAGCVYQALAGPGFRATSGRLRGSLGVKVMMPTIVGGRRFPLKAALASASAFHRGAIPTSTSVQ